MKTNNLEIQRVIDDYQNEFIGIETLAKKYHVGKLTIRKILDDNNIPIRTKNSPRKQHNYVLDDWRVVKYPDVAGHHYVAKAKDGSFVTNDYLNNGGNLTTYIKNTYGVEVPPLYFRREYYKETGNYWWEQWFDIVPVKNRETKKCPYCDWETVDVDNKSGWFQVHLEKEHGMTVDEYLKEHPEDKEYFNVHNISLEREEKLKIDGNYVICPICGNRYWRITESHVLKAHNMTLAEFREKYPDTPVMSKNNYEQTKVAQTKGNLVVSKDRFISKYEREIRDFLTTNGVCFKANRQILCGKEIDILIDSKKIGIEFDGLKWHTEWFGKKSHRYHLEKTEICNQNGYKLLHIFEDEYVNRKEIVYGKLRQILGLNDSLPRIPARKCKVSEIKKADAEAFLEKFHVQGYYKSSVYIGAYYDDRLIAVMSFKNGNVKNPTWELTRFASDYNYVMVGVGGKLFSRFIKTYNPERVVSFADRRWTIDANNNLYTKLGFTLEKKCPPDYRYYNDRVDRYKRLHKMAFAKKTLNKKYGFPMSMTEAEMAKELGYDRIWDCGLFRYVWTNNGQ